MITIKIIVIFFFILFWFIAHKAIGFPKYSEEEFDCLTTGYEIKRIEGTKTTKRYPIKTSLKIGHKIYRNYQQYESDHYDAHSILFLTNSVALILLCFYA